VRSFTDSVNLTFGFPARAGAPAEMRIAFTPEMPLTPGDTVTLTLPGFSGRSVAHYPSGGGNVTWNNALGLLTLRLGAAVAAQQALLIMISKPSP
jgi:hypothetical protein